MGKKKILMITLATICAFLLVWLCYVKFLKVEKLFPNPVNLAQKIANYVVVNRDKEGLNQGEAIMRYYRLRFYDDNKFYEIIVHHQDSNRKLFDTLDKELNINCYYTNRSFASNLNDFIGDEIIFGKQKTFFELRYFDAGIIQKVSAYQIFSRIDSFTREERDAGEGAGIQEFLFDGEKIYQNGKFLEAVSSKEIQALNAGYGSFLQKVANCLKIK